MAAHEWSLVLVDVRGRGGLQAYVALLNPAGAKAYMLCDHRSVALFLLCEDLNMPRWSLHLTCSAASFCCCCVHRQAELGSAVQKASDEREFLRSLNETLLANQKEFGVKLKAAQVALADKDAQLQDLQEQVGGVE